MEEAVGKYWHTFITRVAERHYPAAEVRLDAIKSKLAVWFRVLGGDPSVRINAAIPRKLGQPTTVLQKIACINRSLPLASLGEDCLYLPGRFAGFSEPSFNEAVYYWLVAMASTGTNMSGANWLASNVSMTRKVLTHYPGFERRYFQLIKAYFLECMKYQPSNRRVAEHEAIIRRVLAYPFLEHDKVENCPPVHWVPLWLYPDVPMRSGAVTVGDEGDTTACEGEQKKLEQQDGRQGEYREMPKRDDGLLATRLESLFSWAEYVGVDRPVDEDDGDEAQAVMNDLDVISLSRDGRTTASRLKFDLDLPAEREDQVRLGPGILQPEWDYRKRIMRPDHCLVQELISRHAKPTEPPKHLYHQVRKLRAQFEKLLIKPVWRNAESEGSELDLDVFVQLMADVARGRAAGSTNLYRRQDRSLRDLSCLLLADVSFSTDAYVDDDKRILDCIKDGLHLFSEALNMVGDHFAINGFSSKRRSHVRLTWVKHFDEQFSPIVRGRIADLRAGYYTRMGAAIRYATGQLVKQPQAHKLLLLLTDGKPNDLDCYEGRYGIEDTRMALIEARRRGVNPFCVSIDDKANNYLPYIFGESAYVFVRDVNQLPYKLTRLYLRLTNG